MDVINVNRQPINSGVCCVCAEQCDFILPSCKCMKCYELINDKPEYSLRHILLNRAYSFDFVETDSRVPYVRENNEDINDTDRGYEHLIIELDLWDDWRKDEDDFERWLRQSHTAEWSGRFVICNHTEECDGKLSICEIDVRDFLMYTIMGDSGKLHL